MLVAGLADCEWFYFKATVIYLFLPAGKFIAWMSDTITFWALLFPLFFLATWCIYDVPCGLPNLPRRKLAASFFDSVPPIFMMA